MRILLVDDEADLVDAIARGLRRNGYAVDMALNGEEALAKASWIPYDLICLDITMPGMDGFEVCRSLRESPPEGVAPRILMLTARDTVEERIRGLDVGADDYLVKPFAFAELLARLRALGRRSGAIAPAELTCADLVMSPVDRRVTRAGEPLDLTPKEFGLLELLLRHTGEVVTRTAIIEKVWDMNFYSFTNVVEVLVNRLRKKVDEPFPDRLIHTVRGVGYALRPPED